MRILLLLVLLVLPAFFAAVEVALLRLRTSRVRVLDEQGDTIETVSARALAGRADLLFRRHSSTGTVQCLTNKSAVELNEMLHANN